MKKLILAAIMSIHLYQSKKAQKYIGSKIYDSRESVNEALDPLLIWYVDIFFIQGQRFLVFANPLTKFTFFIFRYNKKSHPNLLQSFRKKLTFTLEAIDINPEKYLEKCDAIFPYMETNKSASAHLSRIKEDYGFMISSRWHDVYPPDDEDYYNLHVLEYVTTFDKKIYDHPKRRFHHELLLRRLA